MNKVDPTLNVQLVTLIYSYQRVDGCIDKSKRQPSRSNIVDGTIPNTQMQGVYWRRPYRRSKVRELRGSRMWRILLNAAGSNSLFQRGSR
jgi:hypothetical protein